MAQNNTVCCSEEFIDPRRFESYKPKQSTNVIPLSNYERLRNMKQERKCCGVEIVPAVHPGGRAKPESARIVRVAALAGRGTLSHYDSNNRSEWNTTLRHQGIAVYAAAMRNSEEAACCVIEGTTTVTPAQTTNVLPASMCGCE